MITRGQSGEHMSMMRSIGGGDNASLGDSGYRKKGFRVSKSVRFGDCVSVPKPLQPIWSGIGYADEPNPLGVVRRPSPINVMSALAGPDDDCVYGHLTEG